MALSNFEGTYKLAAEIPVQYRPLIIRDQPLHEQPDDPSSREEESLAKHI